MHVQFEFGWKIIRFRNLLKHLAISLELSVSNTQHLEAIIVLFSHIIVNIFHVHKAAMKMCFCWTHDHVLWQNIMIVAL